MKKIQLDTVPPDTMYLVDAQTAKEWKECDKLLKSRLFSPKAAINRFLVEKTVKNCLAFSNKQPRRNGKITPL